MDEEIDMKRPENTSARDSWSTGFGFIMSAAGSAVGLGNIWKFPYVCGTNGGAVFLIMYIIFAFLIGYPILMTELSIGRAGRMNSVDSCRRIDPKWGFTGMFGVAGAAAVLTYYSVVGGWVMKYSSAFILGRIPSPDYFSEYSSSTVEPVIWQSIFILLTAAVVTFGISGGIEKVSSVLIPLLLLFLAGLMIYSLSLPGAAEGVRFFLIPQSTDIKSTSDIAHIALKALGQVFFSLSLGMGTLITYGSYLEDDFSITRGTTYIVVIDTVIAVISGLVILPAVFSMGLTPDEGAGLIFSTLTEVFGKIGAGRILGSLFFLLVFFAALTSSISLLEVIVSFAFERTAVSRKMAAVIAAVLFIILSVFASLSFGLLSDVRILGMTIFDLFVFLSDNVIMPLGGIFICILAAWKWGRADLVNEVTSHGLQRFKSASLYVFLVKYVCPAVILTIFISSLIM